MDTTLLMKLACTSLPALLLGIFSSPASSQHAATPVADTMREAWIDPLRGDDLHGAGTQASPYRTATRFWNANVPASDHFGRPIMIDFDGDGDRDLLRHYGVDRTRVFENYGTARDPRYRERRPLSLRLTKGYGYVVCDMNGDGAEDLLEVGWDPLVVPTVLGGLYVRYATPGGAEILGSPVLIVDPGGAPVLIPGGNSTFALGDIDGDALPDLVYFKIDWNRPAGCTHFAGGEERLFWRPNVGSLSVAIFGAERPFVTIAGEIAHPHCRPGASCCLFDLDDDGHLDLLYATESQLFFCFNVRNQAFDAPRRISLIHSADAMEIFGVFERGISGQRWLLLGEGRQGRLATGFGGYRKLYARRLEVQPGFPPLVTTGPPIPWTLEGPIAPPAGALVVHLAPGVYSSTSGESFPWDLSSGGEILGAPGVVIDGGAENVLHCLDLYEMQSYDLSVPRAWRPAWGSRRVVLRDLELATQGDALYSVFAMNLQLEGVQVDGARAAILLGPRGNRLSRPVSSVTLRYSSFRNCATAIEMSNFSLWRQITARDCLFEGNGVGVFATDLRHHLFENCRFLGNQRAIYAFASRDCSNGPCAPEEQLSFELAGCHFAENGEHLVLVSGTSTIRSLRAELWHTTIAGGGPGFLTASSGTEPGSIAVRSSALFPGGLLASGSFAALDIRGSAVNDPSFAAQQGNVLLAPEFALSARDGHQSARSPLRDAAIFAPPIWASVDPDGDPRRLGARADLGADEIRVPALIGAPWAERGTPYTFGILGEAGGAALVLLAAERSAALPLFGGLLWLDPSANTTIALPLLLDARGVGRLDLSVPARTLFPPERLWAQALVLSHGFAPQLTPLLELALP